MADVLPEVNILGYDSDMTSATSTRGRPRSEDRTNAILDSTIELLHDVGFDNLRMQDVADHAGVGLATIYRRWPAKPDLVAAAMACKEILAAEPTGDLDTDLRNQLVGMAEEMGSQGEYIAGLMVATRQHEVMADAIRNSVRASMSGSIGRLMEEKLGSAELVHTLTDTIPGILLFRAGLLDEPIDPEAFADEVMALISAAGS